MIVRINAVHATLLAAVLVVAGCESVEEKAERKYQSATELADAGDMERAIVELRGVFKLNGEHRDARMLYASIMEDRRDFDEAFGHYLLVSEQYPDDFDARLNLTKLAVQIQAWQEAELHANAAKALRPESTELEPFLIATDYARALRERDDIARVEAVERGQTLLQARPELLVVRQVLLDEYLQGGDLNAALEETERALALDPENARLNQIKLTLLAELNDIDGLGEQLQSMVRLFPDNREVRTALVRWYLAQGDRDGAEAFVRSLQDTTPDPTAAKLALVQFLNQVRGPELALSELAAIIDEGGEDLATFQLLQASLRFDTGQRQEAIDQVSAMIDAQEPSEELRTMKTTLARMLISNGDDARARGLVDEVLAQDGRNPAALKMRANWLVDEDQVRDAVLALRTALDEEPEDPETMTLLARAYERGGNRELMAESLALAFDYSNAAPAEALRYARYLVSTDTLLPAEEVLIRALRLSPTNLQLLRSLSEVYLAMNDLPRAEQVVGALNRIDTPEASALATGLQAAVLQRMNRTDESIDLIQSLAEENTSGLTAQTAVIRARLANGELAEARAYMDALLQQTAEDAPERVGLDFLNAALTAAEGDVEGARTIYRALLERNARIEPVWRALIATDIRDGDIAAAQATLDEALEVLPESANLLWIGAGLAERSGDTDAAIAIYERLYERDSSSTVIANNLASLLTTHRADEESLQRAFVIARRLRGADLPAFQDTYGWIAFRLGNYSEALEYLEPAAEGLPNDPRVQYHLARAYEATDSADRARETYRAALELLADGDQTLEAEVEQRLTALDAPQPAVVE